jgi:hypothetical protein
MHDWVVHICSMYTHTYVYMYMQHTQLGYAYDHVWSMYITYIQTYIHVHISLIGVELGCLALALPPKFTPTRCLRDMVAYLDRYTYLPTHGFIYSHFLF